MRSLQSMGWDSFFHEQIIAPQHHHYILAKVVSQQHNTYQLVSEQGDFTAVVTGKFRFHAQQLRDYPVVGDFVVAEQAEGSNRAMIHSVFRRKNYFSRKAPISGGRKLKNGVLEGGTTEEQVIASNIDTVFVMCGMDGNFSVSRIERYLTLAKQQGLETVILLNKMDLCDSIEECLSQVREIAAGSLVLPISAARQIGLDSVRSYMTEGKTIVFLGSSGVGKSTLLNTLLKEEVQSTAETSHYSGKGRHTSTHRELFFHPSGCMIVDTPGMKELQLWAEDEALDSVFTDIADLAAQCKFSNCTHTKEPDCALRSAIDRGVVSRERYERYLSQLKELNRLKEKKKAYTQRFGKKGKS